MKLTPGQIALLILALALVGIGLLRGDHRIVQAGLDVGDRIDADTDPTEVPATDPAPETDTDTDGVEL